MRAYRNRSVVYGGEGDLKLRVWTESERSDRASAGTEIGIEMEMEMNWGFLQGGFENGVFGG